MTIRPYRSTDASALKAMEGEFPYVDQDSPLTEACLVAEVDGEVAAAVTAHRIVELYFHKKEGLHPAVALTILKAMHQEMARELRSKGYGEANAFLPPSICERFGRRLERTFGWVKNWPSLAVRF